MLQAFQQKCSTLHRKPETINISIENPGFPGFFFFLTGAVAAGKTDLSTFSLAYLNEKFSSFLFPVDAGTCQSFHPDNKR
jgi:hypothetical protein